MKSCFHACLFLLLSLFLTMVTASTSAAQTVTNEPKNVTFTVSADDATVTRYELGYFAKTAQGIATDPVQVSDLGHPTADGTGKALVALPARPVAAGIVYVAKARAYGSSPDLVSPWSDPSNEFGWPPRPPSQLATTR